jgi:hypothetical protein
VFTPRVKYIWGSAHLLSLFVVLCSAPVNEIDFVCGSRAAPACHIFALLDYMSSKSFTERKKRRFPNQDGTREFSLLGFLAPCSLIGGTRIWELLRFILFTAQMRAMWRFGYRTLPELRDFYAYTYAN